MLNDNDDDEGDRRIDVQSGVEGCTTKAEDVLEEDVKGSTEGASVSASMRHVTTIKWSFASNAQMADYSRVIDAGCGRRRQDFKL